jgi:ABC-2 type transport system permease protein
MRRELNGVLTIAYRDFTKLLRDFPRLIVSLIFPLLFIGGLGVGIQSNLGHNLSFNFLTFIFTGVLGQVLFQSTASGVLFLIQDRENDFSQELFVSPISRYSIVIGKILGETMVSFVQVLGVIVFGFLVGAEISVTSLISVLPAAILASFFGGAFGIFALSFLTNQRSAQQVFPLLIFPQFVLAGVFNPIHNLPTVQLILSRLMPMTYAVDLVRGVYYWGKPEYKDVVLYNPVINLIIILIMFTLMLTVGTYLFVKNERNR